MALWRGGRAGDAVGMSASTARSGRGLIIAARVIGTAAAGFWALVLVGSAFGADSGESADAESAVVETVGVVSLALMSVAAVGVAWWRPRPGGVLVLAAGLAFVFFALLSAGRNHLLAAATSGGPFVLAGTLFLAGSRQDESER